MFHPSGHIKSQSSIILYEKRKVPMKHLESSTWRIRPGMGDLVSYQVSYIRLWIRCSHPCLYKWLHCPPPTMPSSGRTVTRTLGDAWQPPLIYMTLFTTQIVPVTETEVPEVCVLPPGHTYRPQTVRQLRIKWKVK